ncbi:hypothetical protein WMO21_17760 [Lachnospiraceae bacterium CLA-AA-H58]|uniref:hypothetical protein n=1 Tax=Pilosibacter fragilis TaxID=3078042 RepID=UPI0032D35020
MYEINKRTTGTLSAVQPDLEYIQVRSDPRRVSVSEMYEEDPELEESSDQEKQQPTLFDVMEKICRIVECVTCGGMIYVLARMAGIA